MSTRYLYPDIQHGPDGLVVERLTRANRSEVERLVPAIIDLTRRAYSRQLEEPLGPLAPGTIAAHYTVEERQKPTRRRIDRVFSEWGSYFVVRSSDDPNGLDALLVMVDQAFHNTETGEEKEWAYIFDILADPPRKGLGSAVLHAASLAYGRPDYPGHLHAYRGSEVNAWYERLGFKRTGSSVQVEFGETRIPTDHYVVGDLGAVATNLEATRPELLNIRAL